MTNVSPASSGTTPNEATTNASPSHYDRALAEYGWCRDGIVKYDEHLFRIRSWNMTLTIAIIGGYIGLSLRDGARVTPATMVLAATISCCVFWLLDAMNKSLQMVHIYGSRDLERYLRSDGREPVISPSISLRFQKKQGRHFRPAIKNLSEETVAPFYLLPIAMAALVGAVHSAASARCGIVFAPHCAPASDFHVAALGMTLPAILLSLSLSWRSERSWLRHLGSFGRARKRKALKSALQVFAEIDSAQAIRKTPKRYWPFKANYHTTDLVFFVDSKSRRKDASYLRERAQCLHRLGLCVFSYTGAGRPQHTPSPRCAASIIPLHNRLETASWPTPVPPAVEQE